MYTKIKKITEQIREHGLALGILVDEAVESSKDKRYMAALVCLFVFSEQLLKQLNDVSSGNFRKQIAELLEKGVISDKEYSTLNNLRETRNILFHENHYMYALVKNDKATMYSEYETKEDLWNELSLPILEICLKLMLRESLMV